MNLSEQIADQMKTAMKAKDKSTLRGLRAIKATLLLLNTKEGFKEVTPEDEMSALIKMAKQRRDSISIFEEQNRDDLAQVEKEELAIIEQFLPKQLSEEEITKEIQAIIAQTNADGMKDMGKVMGMASGKLKGKADGKAISIVVKKLLS